MNKVYAILLWFALLFFHNGLFAQNGGVIVTLLNWNLLLQKQHSF